MEIGKNYHEFRRLCITTNLMLFFFFKLGWDGEKKFDTQNNTKSSRKAQRKVSRTNL